MTRRRFAQVDVFGKTAYRGNPVAVVLDGDGLTNEQMASFARWTNLSETTFVVTPTDPGADYGLRIFTPGGELPFAGHPTLGSCHAWLRAGGEPSTPGLVVQECPAGLVRLRQLADEGTADARLAFAAPPLRRSGPVDPVTLQKAVAGLGIDASDVRAHAWVDNGPGWLGILLESADRVAMLAPDFRLMDDLRIGVAGPRPDGDPVDLEVRAFVPGIGVDEDPVTGSLNAGLAQWLIGAGIMPTSYVAGQGRSVGRDGLVFADARNDGVWIGGDTVTCIEGVVALG